MKKAVPKQKNRVDLDEQQSRVVHEYASAKKYANEWTGIASAKREVILGYVEEGEDYALYDEIGVLSATVTEVISKRLDIARLKEDHPEIDFDSYYVASGARQVRAI